MKKWSSFLVWLSALLTAITLTTSADAASVGSGGYTNDFSSAPSASDWSTFSVVGAAADITTAGQVDPEVQLIAASAVSGQTIADATQPPAFNALATWSQLDFYLQTRPTGNRLTVLMCTLINNLGGAANAVTISYNAATNAPNGDEIAGHNVYYSLTGAAGSWIPIPSLSFAVSGRVSATLGINWPSGSALYVLWADDNSVNSPDTANQIDNFSAVATPSAQSPATINTQPQSQAVAELAPASFTVGASGNPPPTYQWYKNNGILAGATNATYAIAAAPLSDSGAEFKVVVANTASNVNYSVTSSVAVLTVNADTTPPTLVRAIGVPPGTVSVDFSEAVRADTANVMGNYAITSPAGNLTISGAVLSPNGSNVTLTTSAQTLGAVYTLIVNGVRDISAASNQIAADSTTTFTSLSFVATDVGSPQPSGTVFQAGNGYDITAGGSDIGGTTDQFTFNYQTRPGDFDVKVRLGSLGLSDAWAKAGLMARETLTGNSRYAASFATPTVSGCFFQYRVTAGTAALNVGAFPATYPNAWLRLKRAGNVFTGYSSLDGNSWSLLGTTTFAAGMPNTLLVGLAVSSRTNGTTTTAQFRDFADISDTPPVMTIPLPFEPLGPSSRRTGLAISEILYHPRAVPTSNSLEFVEIFNSQAFPENLSGYRLSGSIDYTFPTSTVIRAGQFLVVAREPAFVQTHYGISGVLGPWVGADTNNLPGKAGRIRLRDRAGSVLLEVNYEGKDPWPIAADGPGHSLVLSRPSYGEDNPKAWSASDSIDGSPGRAEPFSADRLNGVVINEFLAHTDDPLQDYIEIYNHNNVSVDLSGALLTDEGDAVADPSNTNRYRIPNGTILPPRGFTNFNQSALGFALSASGERIYFANSNGTRVIDMVDFGPQANGRSSGRVPDGSPYIYPLANRTPSAPNGVQWQSPIVINEIMYAPISGNSDDEYVELYNRSTNSVNLGKWKLDGGIELTFPTNIVLGPSNYLVVANNLTNLLARYPGALSSANTVGNYKGSLANSGERIVLTMPDNLVSTNGGGQFVTNIISVAANEVTYGDGGRWGLWSDGGGSSLELKDPLSDNRFAANWADSDETSKGIWTTIEATGPLGETLGSPVNDNLQIFLLGIGECLVDDVEVHNGASANLITTNPGFETGLTGWTLQGSHDQSTAEGTGFSGAQSLHLRAGSRGDNGGNRVRSPAFSPGAGGTVTVRAKAKWVRGWPELMLRIHGGSFEATGPLLIQSNLGTPGAPNSRRVPNAGPAIFDVVHSPILPAAGEDVVVTARASDPQAPSTLVLRYRVDPATTFSSVTMVDTGTNGDAIANDGIYSATILGQSAATTVAFYIEGTDLLGAVNSFPQDRLPTPPLSRVFPLDAPMRECVIRWGDRQMPGSFATYHLWLTAANTTRWNTRRPLLNNAPLDGTFVYNNYRVVYNMMPTYAGSPWHRGQMTTGPDGTQRVDYDIEFPVDDRLLGATDFVWNNPGNPGGTSTSDLSAQTEQTSYLIFKEIDVQYNYRRYVHVFVNGSQRSTTSDRAGNFIMEDSQQPNTDIIAQWYPDNTDGQFYKIEDWFEFPDNGDDFTANNDADLNRRNVSGTANLNIAPYRFMFRNRALGAGESANEYTPFVELVNVISPPANPSSTTIENVAGFNDIADIEQWMRIFAVQHTVGNWDSYCYRRGKNAYTYKPNNGRFVQWTWDIDFTMGVGGDGTTQDIFDNGGGSPDGDERVAAMWNTPAIRRMYWRAFQDILNGPLNNSFMDPILDAKAAAMAANGVNYNPATVTTIKSYISGRRAYILGLLNTNVSIFSVLVSGTNYLATNNNLVTITGTAPIAVKDVYINGIAYPVTWTSVGTWTARLVVGPGTNALKVAGVDLRGNFITSTQMLSINYTGQVASVTDSIVFNEIMYNPTNLDASFVEIFNKANLSFDLSGWQINGLGYTFPIGSVITNRQYLVLAKNQGAFAAAYGSSVLPFDAFDGILDLDGETLTLLQPSGVTNTPDVVIDKIRYEARRPWVLNANGVGSSLQLIDASIDNSRVSDWSDGIGWRSFTTNINIGASLANSTNLYMFLDAAGDVYLDDISLAAQSGPTVGINIIQNGGFEAALAGSWNLGANMSNSVTSSDPVHSGNASFHLIQTAAGFPTISGSVWQTLPMIVNTVYTLTYWYFPTTNANKLTARWNSAARPENIVKPGNYYTPGAPNQTADSLPPYDPIWLNEIQPNNVAGPVDNFGQRDPWVEIYNGGASPVSLAGYYLADNYTNNLTQWQFPGSATINPGEFKVVWLDNQIGQTTPADWHANFRPGLSTGQVALVRIVANKPQIVDYLTYSDVGPSLSYGDFPDGQPFNRQVFFTVTPGATNFARSDSLFINEWMASNIGALADPADGQYKDWFEIYNASTNAVNLGNYYLTDNTSLKTRYRVPNNGQYVVPAGGFLLVWADGFTNLNSGDNIDLHVNFSLNQGGEEIGLYAVDGQTEVDSVAFNTQFDDVSQGRFSDGADAFYFMTNTTPRAANALGSANGPPVLAFIPDVTVAQGQLVSFTATATDPDMSGVLSFGLDSGPAGANMTSGGLFTWQTSMAVVPGSYDVTVHVTDGGSPVRSDTQLFRISVVPPVITISNPGGGQVSLTIPTIPGHHYQLVYKNTLSDPNWLPLGSPVLAAGNSLTFNDNITGNPQRFYQVHQID